MTNEAYRAALREIGPSEELLEQTLRAMRGEKRRRNRIAAWAAAGAACLLILFSTALWMSAGHAGDSLMYASPQGSESWSQGGLMPKADQIHLNELGGEAEHSLDQKAVLPEGSEIRALTQAQVIDYLGVDPRPCWLPEGVLPQEGESYSVAFAPDGKAVADTVVFSYSDSGGAEEYEPLTRRVQLTASRLGIVSDIVYSFPQESVPTRFGWVDALVGHRVMDYGPYDPETHEPAGTYDLYVAQFNLLGVHCEVVAENLSLEEFSSVVASMVPVVCGNVCNSDAGVVS